MPYYWGSAPSLRWHDLLPLRDAIDRKTACINEDYDLVFGDDPVSLGARGCETGYTDFQRRQCWVNTEALKKGSPNEQFIATVFLAAHERAHARYTDYVESDFHRRHPTSGEVQKDGRGRPIPDGQLHNMWNILEDERIERLLGRDFPHLHRYLARGNEMLLSLVDPAGSDDNPAQILTWVLRRRLFTRAGKAEPCPLSPANQARLAEIEDLLEEAFSCTSSRRVVEIAREILQKLQLDGQDSLGQRTVVILSGQKGERGEGDAAEADGATAEEGQLYALDSLGDGSLQKEVQELMQSTGYSPNVRRGGAVSPAPYLDLLGEVRPYVDPLRHLFQIPPSKRSLVLEETGARLSMRALRRSPKTPFRVETPPTRRGNVALTLVIDDSGSMSGNREHQAKLTTLMCLEAMAGAHKVRAVLAPSGRVVVDQAFGEMNRAYIAGYDSNSGTEYAEVMAAEATSLLKLGRRYARYFVLVADGASGDHDIARCAVIAQKLRKAGVHTIGIGVELETASERYFQQIFGDRFVALRQASELPVRMQAIMRRVARNTQHHGVA
jgi:hypothetical protein